MGCLAFAGLVALTGCARSVQVDVPSPDVGAATVCRQLLAALPDTVASRSRREVSPSGALAAAWGDPAIVLRCGVPEPAAMSPSAQVVEVDGVTWLPEELTAGYLFTTYRRAAFVEVSVPDDYAPEGSALVDLAAAVKQSIPEA